MTPDHGLDQGPAGFDELLRRVRRSAGLTQADLAARAGVGVRTVRDLERGRSMRPQRTTVELIATALGLTGADRSAFVAAARNQGTPGNEPVSGVPADAASGTRTAAPTLALPPVGELIGRDRDVLELAGMLTGADGAVPALVSLVGLAGVGKSALGLAVAHRVVEQFPGGAAGIVISELSTTSDVLSAVATVFTVGRPADLAGRLAAAPALLLVDAVERSPNAVAEALQQLARAAPTLRVLAMGRHPVGLPGERVWPVTPLEVPPAGPPGDLGTVAGYPAVALFLARLRQVRREPPRPDEVGALVGLVRRLGGLPLAIELAAARGRILDLNEIIDRYGDRLLDLAGPPATRQAVGVSLRDAVAASYRLLDPGERAALRRLSAFRNRWSVELAEGMLTDERERSGEVEKSVDAVPLLDRLLALGLLSSRGTGPFRFRLLDVVRDFASERAAVNAELTEIRRRHAVLFARLAESAAQELVGANLAAAVRRLDDVSSDLWAALAHAATDDPHTALRLAASLPRWWRFRGRDVAGRQWLRRLLDDPRTADADPVRRAWAQVGVAQLAQEHSAGPEELPAAQAALTTFQRVEDVAGELAARSVLCGLWVALGGHDEARRHGEAVLALAERTGRVRDMAVAQNNLTWHDIRVGDLRAARRRLAAVDRLSAQCGEERLRVLARANLAELARLDGRYADAVEQGRRVLSALRDLGDPGHHRRVLGTIGLALAEQGRFDEAGAVLDELRSRTEPGDGTGPAAARGQGPGGATGPAERDAGICALIEATLALRRGDRDWAAEWYAAAAEAYAGSRDLRDVAESLVGLVASTEDPRARSVAQDRLTQVCREGGITLLPRERKLIAAALDR
ncbi:helix-turn-helix domain-containing protein [Micromonospora sp. NPDC049559]|uniref:ATP-binding protein n=1 Tax=Micromonospora sp. NPDC049559 TaxID=3155923 RepID=UPI0034308D17